VFLPDGRHFLFAYLASKPETAGIYAGSIDGDAPVRIVSDVSNPGYTPGSSGNGYLVFIRERTLMAQPFDDRALRTTGEVFPVVQQLTSGGNTANFAYSISANGVMAYQVGPQGRSIELAWVDRAGKRLDGVSQALQFLAFALAPDEMRIAVSIAAFEKSVSQADIWRLASIRGTPSRFTYGPARGWSFPVWSPDGVQLAYATYNVVGLSSYEIRRKSWNMSGKEELLLRGSSLAFPRDWSPDGKWLLYSTTGDLWLLPLEGDHKPIPFTQTPASNEDFGQFSPDGKWMAYASNESGQDQVYVQPIPATGAKWQLSSAGGSYPKWRSDGKELFFLAADGKLMAVPIAFTGARNPSSSGGFESGAPQALFDIGDGNLGATWAYQPGAGGQHFLIAVPSSGEKPPAITVVLNWQAGLKK
jgi:dipeptidyl aminopeptidase/acylaminoacyl peptidase